MEQSDKTLLLAGLSLAVLAGLAHARESILLDDFESTTMTAASSGANNTGTVLWEDLDLRWGGRNRLGDTPDWQIVPGADGNQLQCMDADNNSTQCAAAYRVSFAGGVDWMLEFDAPLGDGWNDIDIYLGVDDGDNDGTEKVIEAAKTNGTLYNDVITGDWLHLINNGWNGVDTYSIDIGNHVTIDFNAEGNLPANLADYDLLVIRFQNRSADLKAYDNLQLTYETPPTPPTLHLARSGSALTFTWDSEFGKLYDLMTTDATGLPTPVSTWTPLYTDLPATEPLNTQPHTWTGGPVAFFVVIEKDGPALFEDDFETDKGWTTGGSPGDAPGTTWQRGIPSASAGPSDANSPFNCFATNIAGDYSTNADVWLRSPVIHLTNPGITSATLSFFHYRDIEQDYDFGYVRILDADAGDTPLVGVPDLFSEISNLGTAWEELTVNLPAAAIGKNIKIEFQFTSDNINNFTGWAIDDVKVEVN